MSGGHFNYISFSLANELGFPSGSYGIGEGKYGSYEDDIKETRLLNPMYDQELSELIYDVDCLLHGLEWWQSGDIGGETYFKDVEAFKAKWFCRNSQQSIEAYRKDISTFVSGLLKGVNNEQTH